MNVFRLYVSRLLNHKDIFNNGSDFVWTEFIQAWLSFFYNA